MADSLERNRNGGIADATERSEASTGQSAVAAAASFAEGGCLSNTHPQTSQDGKLPGLTGCIVSGGYDWLSWTASVDWDRERYKLVMPELERAKAGCQELREPFRWIEFDGFDPIRIYRMGFNRGGTAGQHFEFKLSYRDIGIGLSKEEYSSKFQPNTFVQLTGRNCLLLGATEAYRIVRRFLRDLGCQIRWERIARADFTLDVAGLDIRDLQEAAEQRRFITGSKNVKPHENLVGDQKTGFTVGKAPLRMTAYDKLGELATKADALYLQAMIDRRYGGVRPQHAARIEFQALRPWLTNHSVDSPDDLFRLSGAIVDKLTRQWFRLTEYPVDRKHNNQQRAEVMAAWIGIQEGFAKIFGQPEGELVPIRRESVRPERLIKQGFGCLTSAMLQMGRQCEGFDDVLLHITKFVESIFPTTEDEKKFVAMYQRRLTEYAA